jgi:hypothetical protein
MDQPETITNSFIVKIWLEETIEEAGRAIWRGHITHVPNGGRRYIENLDEIIAFIAPYMEEMGVKPSTRSSIRQWMKRFKRRARQEI